MNNILHYKTELYQNGNVVAFAFLDKTQIAECKIILSKDYATWTISSWYTVEGYGNQGYGTRLLKYTLKNIKRKYGSPNTVEYVWNGANQYVYDWMRKHFGAVSRCPIAIQKNNADDDWESHIYTLNCEKVLEYLEKE